jgi:DNA invertase Pin-like site-specific DNA recombinase
MARIKSKEAAGLDAKRGKHPIGKQPGKSELKELYIKESRSIREIANALGCTKDRVYRALKEYGIERRPHTWESRLSQYDLEFLREIIRKRGYRKGAQELGVDKSTLYRYMRRVEK